MANPVKLKVEVVRVERHTDGVVTYSFKPQGRVPKFRAGQFLHLALDDYRPDAPWPESRVFSIASAPSERHDKLSVTISTKGRYTMRIVDELKEGGICWLKLPYGEFIFPPSPALTLVAGGVGITPFLSLLKQMLEQKSAQTVTLYYGFRSMDHYLFRDLLDACVRDLPNFKLVIYSEEEIAEARSGILNINTIASESSADALFYLSGPPAMIDTFKSALLSMSFPDHQILIDAWE